MEKRKNILQIAEEYFNGKLKYDDLDITKVYARIRYREYFIELDNVEQYEKWKRMCIVEDEYAFYDGVTCYDLPTITKTNFENEDFIKQFVRSV